VQGQPQSIEVGARVAAAAGQDLRRGVVGRAGERAGRGDAGLAVEASRAEVGQPKAPVGVEEHVLGLHVPVEDAPAVRRAEGGSQIPAQTHGLVGRERPPFGHSDMEVRAGHVLHDDEAPGTFFHEVVDGDDVLVGERPDDLHLAAHALAGDLGGRRRGYQQLHRHLGVQLEVTGEVHDRMASAAELPADDPPAAETGSGFQVGLAHGPIRPRTSRALERQPSSDR
jgi:hypothetical protein